MRKIISRLLPVVVLFVSTIIGADNLFDLIRESTDWAKLLITYTHRNISFGPWSGLSMHPLEHLIFFSHVLPFLFIPMHPVVVMFMLIGRGIGPAGGHAGYHKFLRKGDGEEKPMRRFLYWGDGADFFHHLHHQYFTVNFAGNLFPLDKWFHTFHDGSPESHQLMLGKKIINWMTTTQIVTGLIAIIVRIKFINEVYKRSSNRI